MNFKMAKYILSAVLIGVAWSLSLYLGVSLVWPIVATAAIALALFAWVLVQAVRTKRAARDLEKKIAAQGEKEIETARPDIQEEVRHMQGEFQKAVSALESSKLGQNGIDALYALPWYVIVGPPGSGKTTALQQSGLQFPKSSVKGGLRGVGGTRNCDWWLSSQGVLLDTAGRWTQAEDTEEWFAFLDIVKQCRPRKPLNGIIVAVSLDELGNADEQGIQAVSRRVRDRIDEILSRLQLRLPVYVLFTKADLVPGFVESYQDMTPQERAQILGFTLPLEQKPDDVQAAFTERFDELHAAIERFSVRRMSEVPQLDVRERVLAFPQQLAVLRENLAEFVSLTFEDNVFEETPALRGVYFTSGTQEGSPIDRVMQRMAQAFGVNEQVNVGGNTAEPKSYFLRDVFQRVVFQDDDLAARSVTEVKRQQRARWLTAASIFGVAAFVVSFPTYAWVQNDELVSSTERLVTELGTAKKSEGGVALTALEPLREQAASLRRQVEDGAPMSMRFGMYQGDELAPAITKLYADTLRSDVLSPVVAADLSEVDAFGRRYEALGDVRPTAREYAQMYGVLKAYLLMTVPREAQQPGLEEKLTEWLTEGVVPRWVANDVALMKEHVRFFAELLSEDPELAFPRDEGAVRRTRIALTRIPQASLVLERLIQEMEPTGYGITLRGLVGQGVSAMSSRGQVRAAFTRRAWENRVRDTLAAHPSTLAGDAWVLGPQSRIESSEEALRELASAYFEQYIEEWQTFVRGVSIPAPNGEFHSLTMLQDLTRGEPSPLGQLVRQVHYNLQLTYPAPEGEETEGAVKLVAGKIADKTKIGRAAKRALDSRKAKEADRRLLTAEDVAEAFEGFTAFAVPVTESETPQPTSLDVYLEQLGFVRDALQSQLDSPGSRDQLNSRLAAARVRVRALIEQQAVGWRPRFEALLWPPIEGTSLGSTKAAAAGVGKSWCADVVRPFSRNLASGYPFAPEGQDVSLGDFIQFFKRRGQLWSYYDDVLDHAVEREGEGFQFATRLGRDASVVYAPGLPSYLRHAQDVTQSFFPAGLDVPLVEFDVQIQPTPRVATTELSVGGTTIKHDNGPERWRRVTWPGERPEQGASIVLRGEGGLVEEIEQEGEWGLFHLLEQGTVVEGDARVFTLAFKLRTNDVETRIVIRPVRADSPFFGVSGRGTGAAFMEPVRAGGLELPREIVTGERLCRN